MPRILTRKSHENPVMPKEDGIVELSYPILSSEKLVDLLSIPEI
ncbi:5898_t:CDS:2 [Acaulospora morrowiae]|uniref:5898_t:CDS:1 n=1 Tax=Acaulospora morrowiae TaxID=94023 RepID=A0A9N8VJE6_9GLOM|nr:5898_t:CDS:2 [Acaulospora morrowiae]